MDEKNKKILDCIDKEALFLVKNEAELLMDEITISENTVINKANNYFQLLFAICFALIGFLVSRSDKYDPFSLLNQISLIFLVSFFSSLFFLSKILYLKAEGLKGAIPKNLLQEDIFDNSENQIELLLSSRIKSLQKCIIKRIDNQNNRNNDLKVAIAIIIVSIIVVSIYSFFYIIC